MLQPGEIQMKGCVKSGGRSINKVRFAGDTFLLAETSNGLKGLLGEVNWGKCQSRTPAEHQEDQDVAWTLTCVQCTPNAFSWPSRISYIHLPSLYGDLWNPVILPYLTGRLCLLASQDVQAFLNVYTILMRHMRTVTMEGTFSS